MSMPAPRLSQRLSRVSLSVCRSAPLLKRSATEKILGTPSVTFICSGSSKAVGGEAEGRRSLSTTCVDRVTTRPGVKMARRTMFARTRKTARSIASISSLKDFLANLTGKENKEAEKFDPVMASSVECGARPPSAKESMKTELDKVEKRAKWSRQNSKKSIRRLDSIVAEGVWRSIFAQPAEPDQEKKKSVAFTDDEVEKPRVTFGAEVYVDDSEIIRPVVRHVIKSAVRRIHREADKMLAKRATLAYIPRQSLRRETVTLATQNLKEPEPEECTFVVQQRERPAPAWTHKRRTSMYPFTYNQEAPPDPYDDYVTEDCTAEATRRYKKNLRARQPIRHENFYHFGKISKRRRQALQQQFVEGAGPLVMDVQAKGCRRVLVPVDEPVEVVASELDQRTDVNLELVGGGLGGLHTQHPLNTGNNKNAIAKVMAASHKKQQSFRSNQPTSEDLGIVLPPVKPCKRKLVDDDVVALQRACKKAERLGRPLHIWEYPQPPLFRTGLDRDFITNLARKPRPPLDEQPTSSPRKVRGAFIGKPKPENLRIPRRPLFDKLR